MPPLTTEMSVFVTLARSIRCQATDDPTDGLSTRLLLPSGDDCRGTSPAMLCLNWFGSMLSLKGDPPCRMHAPSPRRALIY